MPKPSLLLISASSIIAENRKRISTLAESFDLTCVTCRTARSLGFDVSLRADEQPSDYHLISLPTLGRAESTTRYLFRGLGKLFASRAFDVVLVESEPWAWVRWQAWLWKKIRQPRALFGEFSWENTARTGLKGAILGRLYRLAAATDDFVIAGNRAAKNLFCGHGLDPARALVAPQIGVDEILFSPIAPGERAAARTHEGIPLAAYVIGYCGRFIAEKGVTDLIAAVDLVRPAHSSSPLALALLGSGPLQPELERLASERPWLRLLGPRPHAAVAGFMAMLDLLVLPSKPSRAGGTVWEEQFGHVLIEAMCCGVAAIGSDSGAIHEVLGEAALIFPAGDIPALAGHIAKMIADTETGARLRQRVLEHFTNRAVGTRWAEFLLAQLARKSAAAS